MERILLEGADCNASNAGTRFLKWEKSRFLFKVIIYFESFFLSIIDYHK